MKARLNSIPSLKALQRNTRFNKSCAKENVISRPPPGTPVMNCSEIVRATFAQKGSRLFRLPPSASLHLYSVGILAFQLISHRLLSVLIRNGSEALEPNTP